MRSVCRLNVPRQPFVARSRVHVCRPSAVRLLTSTQAPTCAPTTAAGGSTADTAHTTHQGLHPQLVRKQFTAVAEFATRPIRPKSASTSAQKRGLATCAHTRGYADDAGVGSFAASRMMRRMPQKFMRKMYQPGHDLRWKGFEYNNSLQVPFRIENVPGQGDGLFAASAIRAGDIVFNEADVFEEEIPRHVVVPYLKSLETEQARRILHHSYAQGSTFHWCKDTAALFNHSTQPSVAPDGDLASDDTVWRATRDMAPDEEFVFDYNGAFEGEPEWFANLFEEILKEEYPDHSQWA